MPRPEPDWRHSQRRHYPIAPRALDVPVATDYDRAHLLAYACVLDAADAGADWREAAAAILGCDVTNDLAGAEACWTSHLERARWLVGEGLVQMVTPEA